MTECRCTMQCEKQKTGLDSRPVSLLCDILRLTSEIVEEDVLGCHSKIVEQIQN